MEQRGLVERRRDAGDRRVVKVAATDEGRLLIEGLAAERRDHLAIVLAELTDEELAAYLTGARAMRRARERLHAARADEAAQAGAAAGTARAASHEVAPGKETGR
jgi:DNA-binding MarR family transcriptional regulator